MLDLLAGFVTELRNAGLPVSLTENLDAMEAVQHIPIEDRDAFKYALGATLVKNNAHWRAFETKKRKKRKKKKEEKKKKGK